MKQFDFYRRVPVDLTEPTAPGVIISLFCMILMLLLFVGELRSYLSPPTRADMFVAPDEGQGSRLRVTFNMTYHRLPCFLLSLDVIDVLGNHEVDVQSSTTKTRLSHSGGVLGIYSPGSPPENAEGCNIVGHVNVAKVPGNFHVSAHGHPDLAMRAFPQGIDVQHTVHHMHFGDVDLHMGRRYEGVLHPLNGVSQRDEPPHHYQYYLDIVPTVYATHPRVERGYQFTYTMNKMVNPAHHMAAVFFQYQLSPITVKYANEETSFAHFLTYVCAIVGGVFTVAGIVSRIVHTTAVQFQRRLLGKDH